MTSPRDPVATTTDGSLAARLRPAATRPLALAALVTFALSLVFLLAPHLDIAVAALFHAPGVGVGTEFPAENSGFLQALRRSGMGVTRWATILIVLALLAKTLTPLLARAIPTRPLLFLATSLALGPGLLVNAVFKEVWGRPRPSETTLFGGPWTFFPAWVPGGSCPTNCSFPSGEASGAAWLLALVFVVPERWRRPTLAAVLVWMVVISANRMAFGSHFLSDVLIGWSLMLCVVLICREAILVRLSDATLTRLERGLARLGERALGHLGRRDRGAAAEHF